MARIWHFLCSYLVVTAPLVDARRLQLGGVRQVLDTQEKTEAAEVQVANVEEATATQAAHVAKTAAAGEEADKSKEAEPAEVQVAEKLVEKEQSLMEEESEANARATPVKVLAMLLAGFSNLTNAYSLYSARPVNVAGQRLAVKGPTMLIGPGNLMEWIDKGWTRNQQAIESLGDENLENKVKVFDAKLQAEFTPKILKKTMQWIDELDENKIKVFDGKVRAKTEDDSLDFWSKVTSQVMVRKVRVLTDGDWKHALKIFYEAASEGDGVRGICEDLGIEDDFWTVVPFLDVVMSTAQDMREDDENVDLARELAARVAASNVE